MSEWCPKLRLLDLRGNLKAQGSSSSRLVSSSISTPIGAGSQRLPLLRFIDLGGAPSPFNLTSSSMSEEELLGANMGCVLSGDQAQCCKDDAQLQYFDPPRRVRRWSGGCKYAPWVE